MMESNNTHILTIAVGAAVVFFFCLIKNLRCIWIQSQFAKVHGCEPVLPASKDPLFGIDVLLENIQAAKSHRFLELIQHRFQRYGNTFRVKRFTTPFIITCEPANLKGVLSLNFRDYGLGSRIATFGPLLGRGIFTSDGEHWAQSRAMVRPNFVKDQIADLEKLEELMQGLLALIPTDGSTVDLQDLFFCYTLDSATEFLFGHSVQSLNQRLSGVVPDDSDFASAFNYAQHAIARNTRLGFLGRVIPDHKATQSNRICHSLVEQFIDKALKYREEYAKKGSNDEGRHTRYLFLQGLAEQTGDRDRIRDELMNILLAGRDTTASLLSNLFFMLVRRPKIWKKLREEVATLNGRAPTYQQLRNLTYLKHCLNESLRFHPVVPVNSRKALSNTVLPVGSGPNGKSPVFVRKGTIVFYSVWAMHRRQDLYGPDANEFRPERWADLRPGWEYLPFNGGPRICIGQQYALTEAAYVTVRLAQQFSTLETRDPGPWEEALTLTLCSRNGTKVCLRH
ncbi:cytochrome P450 alkane hydroxylase [Aspergillus piperis CBS 112811]|uniref:Cytochrome P450 alkane hydroxylase n=1 Tax=Aspergillus piperis CBS 112811 TaxID=1448313 RepID=A0A8G1QWY9_9EURO|nr:cytochrome P450 alkane hydroxylase [Aspergillus piperis CBS 112811]RAH54526.1 cytochrome P450 alkane hydroxylase [Aspergillus piperis CBS 112811]